MNRQHIQNEMTGIRDLALVTVNRLEAHGEPEAVGQALHTLRIQIQIIDRLLATLLYLGWPDFPYPTPIENDFMVSGL